MPPRPNVRSAESLQEHMQLRVRGLFREPRGYDVTPRHKNIEGTVRQLQVLFSLEEAVDLAVEQGADYEEALATISRGWMADSEGIEEYAYIETARAALLESHSPLDALG